MYWGHPECSIVCSMFTVQYGKNIKIVESARRNRKYDLWVFRRADQLFGDYVAEGSLLQHAARIFSLLIRNPLFLLQSPFYLIYRLWGIKRWLPRFLWALISLKKIRVKPAAIVIHKFMSSHELGTELGKERLAACAFKVPHNGEMVSMCEFNGTDMRKKQVDNLVSRYRKTA